MRFGSCLLLLCLLSATVYGKKQPAKQAAPQVVLQTQLDSVSYAMGIFMGSQVAKHVEHKVGTRKFLPRLITLPCLRMKP
jgi:hypothetical protein